MSRYATLDPTLISSAFDKRKALSGVAPSAAKKKRTSKKLLIQVKILSFLSIKPLFILIIVGGGGYPKSSDDHPNTSESSQHVQVQSQSAKRL
jgi:hypothetical protein